MEYKKWNIKRVNKVLSRKLKKKLIKILSPVNKKNDLVLEV